VLPETHPETETCPEAGFCSFGRFEHCGCDDGAPVLKTGNSKLFREANRDSGISELFFARASIAESNQRPERGRNRVHQPEQSNGKE